MQVKAELSIHPSLANFDSLPDNAYIRPQVAKEILGVSIATFWRLVVNEQIKTHKLTARTTTVRVGDLRAFLAKKTSE